MRPPLYDANIGLQKSRIRTHNTQRWGPSSGCLGANDVRSIRAVAPHGLREIERASERMEKEYIFLPHFPRAELLHYPNSRQSMQRLRAPVFVSMSPGEQLGTGLVATESDMGSQWRCQNGGGDPLGMSTSRENKKKVTCLSDSPYSFGPFTASIRKNGDVIRYARLKYLQPDAMGCISESDMLIHIRWNQLPFSVGFEFPGGDALRLGT